MSSETKNKNIEVPNCSRLFNKNESIFPVRRGCLAVVLKTKNIFAKKKKMRTIFKKTHPEEESEKVFFSLKDHTLTPPPLFTVTTTTAARS